MGSVGRAARLVVLSCAVLTCAAGTVRGNEIWVAPTLQQDLGGIGIASNGIWPATPAGAVRLAWGVPGNLQSFTGARLVLIPHSPGGAATLTVYVCAARSGDMAAAACTGPFNHAFTGVPNQLLEVDISAAIAPQVGPAGANHLAVLAYTTPTTATDRIVGLRFAYDAVIPAGTATLGANTFSGAQTAPAFIGDGSGLTNVPLPASAATLGANTFSGTQTAPAFVGNGAALTNLPFPAGAATLGANTFAGTQAVNGGNLDLDPSSATAGQLTQNGAPLLHTFGTSNTFLGAASGNLALTGTANTGIGGNALAALTSGSHNTAVGFRALDVNTTGTFNTAVGRDALRRATTAIANTAIGYQALMLNDAGEGNTATGTDALESSVSGAFNTATGTGALRHNHSGNSNTALGTDALERNTSGHSNLALGRAAGFNATTGSNNIYLGSFVTGLADESNTMYLGRVGTQTRTFMAGVRGTAPANADALPVVIDSAGQLGTVSPTGIATLTTNTFAGTQAVDGGNLDLDPSTELAGNLTKNGTRFLHNFGSANVFLGANAGNFTMLPAADGNTAIGASALRNVTTGGGNTAVGANALSLNLEGSTNTATGAAALFANTTGGGNTADGANALADNTGGFENTASGHSALRLNTTGDGNTGVGVSALHSNLAGNSNTAMGRHALRNATGHNNAALGFAAGLNATTGSNNIYVGTNVAGEAGESNTMYLGRVGTQTKTVIAGVRGASVAGGQMVLVDSAGRLGSGPVATGANTVGTGEVIDGSLNPADVGFNYAASATKGGAAGDLSCAGCVGPSEVSFSFATLGANTFNGSQSVVGGNVMLADSTATTGNITKGGNRFLHNFGVMNTFVGENAGNLATTGQINTGVGFEALAANTSGNYNSGFGEGALAANTTGNWNTAVGAVALRNNTVGTENTAVGQNALRDNIDGSGNVGVGQNAGLHLTSGSDNVFIGEQAGFFAGSGSNNVIVGANVLGVLDESNAMYLGKVGTQTKTIIAGVRGITTLNANAVNVVIDSAGQLGTISSSRRFKEDIRDMDAASERLLQLRPVTFRYTQPFADGAKPLQYGLIAEEVADVFPDLAVRGADGRIETVQYQKLDAMLLNELQKLYREVQALKAEVAGLRQPRTDRK